MKYKTEQEVFWSGSFGDEYINRNFTNEIIAGNINLFSQVLRFSYGIKTVLEVGANVGQNLIAIKQLLPKADYTAVEINKKACKNLTKYSWIRVINQSVLEYHTKEKFDFVLTKGLLIHINPRELQKVYETIHHASKKYICVVEYYNPKPVEIPYRGFSGMLFKRDFAGDLLDKYSDLKLIKYGFSYHRDNNFPQDDLTWFLLEKS